MNGDEEAKYLAEIGEALKGTEVGLQTIGLVEGGFTIVALLQSGVVISFTHGLPVKVKDEFVAWMALYRDRSAAP